MTYTIKFTNEKKPPIIIEDYKYDGFGSPVKQSTTLTLFGKGSSDYGESLWTNLVHMLENHCHVNAPLVPVQGQLWFSSAGNGKLKLYKQRKAGLQQYQWFDIIDEELLKEKLLDPEFLENSVLPRYVKLAREGTTFNGNLTIRGNLIVEGRLFAKTTPTTQYEVINFAYFNTHITSLENKFLPLEFTGSKKVNGNVTFNGTTNIIGKLLNDKISFENNEYITKQFLTSEIGKAGLSLPSYTTDGVLMITNNTPNFAKVKPINICHQTEIPEGIDNMFNVITSDNEKSTWKNLDSHYVNLGGNQVITGNKGFDADVDFYKAIKLNGNAGQAGQVLMSNGPDNVPSWGGAEGGFAIPPGTKDFVYAATGNDSPVGIWKSLSDLLNPNNSYNFNEETITTNIPGYDKNNKSFKRGYIKLTDKIAIQWISNFGISNYDGVSWYNKNSGNMVNTWTNLKSNTSDSCVYALPTSGIDVAVKFKYAIPFKSIFFTNVSTDIINSVDINNANSNEPPFINMIDLWYQTYSAMSDLNYITAIRQWTNNANPHVQVAPVIFSIGTY